MKTVVYDGYEISVPAGWPVYRLGKHSRRCVRYDIHAVYLGTPGPDQDCPPGLVGRTQAVLISPGRGAVASREAAVSPPVSWPAGAPAPEAVPAASGGGRARARGRFAWFAREGAFRAVAGDSGVSVLATYGTDPAQAGQILRSLRKAPAGRVPSGGSAAPRAVPAAARAAPDPPPGAAGTREPAQTAAGAPAAAPAGSAGAVPPGPPGPGFPGPSPKAPGTTGPGASAVPAGSASPGPAPPASPPQTAPTAAAAPPGPGSPALSLPHTPQAGPVTGSRAGDVPQSPLAGFDTCTAPPLSAMKAWRSRYAAAGIYIGGQDMACDYGNLSASWVASARAMGWSLLPVYVGLQAPCTSFGGRISAGDAAAQGKAAAGDAAGDAGRFGLGRGTPIYYDMEAYSTSNTACRTAVLTFLNAWTTELHARGYLSGVYSSASAAIETLASAPAAGGQPPAEPDAIWFGLWDGRKNLDGAPYLPASAWASDRTKQYAGGHTQQIGGYTLDIDSDWVGSAVAGPERAQP
ncbi:MAG TPA: DUF1906 domain-containing protein [Streptosporangiaceae bacterium]|nr:DUF1906 domain-containing protein [Streptosporangiaceae bacterium]